MLEGFLLQFEVMIWQEGIKQRFGTIVKECPLDAKMQEMTEKYSNGKVFVRVSCEPMRGDAL